MDIAKLGPLACTALDTSLDASGGGLALLCTRSGTKLRMALERAVSGTKTIPLQLPMAPASQQLSRSSFAHWRVGRHGAWHLPATRPRWSCSLVPEQSVECANAILHASELSVVPNPRSHAACEAGVASWVSDPGNLLTSSAREELQHILERMNTQTGVECALVLQEDLRDDGSDPARFREFGTRLFNHWGVGSVTHDSGVLILLFTEARRLEIVSGAGMSRVLPDSWLFKMQQRVMVPCLKAADYAAGLKAGLLSIEQHLALSALGAWSDFSESLILGAGCFGHLLRQRPFPESRTRGFGSGYSKGRGAGCSW